MAAKKMFDRILIEDTIKRLFDRWKQQEKNK